MSCFILDGYRDRALDPEGNCDTIIENKPLRLLIYEQPTRQSNLRNRASIW